MDNKTELKKVQKAEAMAWEEWQKANAAAKKAKAWAQKAIKKAWAREHAAQNAWDAWVKADEDLEKAQEEID